MSSSLSIVLTNALVVAFVALMPVNSRANFKSFEILLFLNDDVHTVGRNFTVLIEMQRSNPLKNGIMKNILLILLILFCLS